MMRISTIIPAYNRADLIAATLESILSQTRAPSEVIVVDDGSTDGTADVVRAFGQAITLICQANAGAAAARNAGLAHATGEIVHFMDSDDISSLNSYDVQGRAIESGADMTYGPWLKTRFSGRLIEPEKFAQQQRRIPAGVEIDRAVLLLQWVTVFQPCLFRRSLIDSAGPYRTDLKPSEDSELLYRLARRARRIEHTPETIVLYRVHPENQVSVQNPAQRLVDWANLLTVFQEHADARSDLGLYDRFMLRAEKLLAARDVWLANPALANTLDGGASGLDLTAVTTRKFANRVGQKIRMMRHGYSMSPLFGLGKLTAEQKKQIDLLGYTFGQAENA